MSGRFKQFNLSLPEDLYNNLKELAPTRHVSMTHYIREAVRAKVDTDLTGQKKCATGEACSMAIFAGASSLNPKVPQ